MQGILAGLSGLFGGSALVLGAIMGLYSKASLRTTSAIMAIGSGVLISAVAFGLMDDAYNRGGLFASTAGLITGALFFYLADQAISRVGGANRKRSSGQNADVGWAIAVGSLMDDIPEALAIGITFIEGGAISWALIAAVFLSNIPESLSSAVGMRKAGYSTRFILGLWSITMLVCGACSWAGYHFFSQLPGETVAFMQSFAGGAILAMLASTMMPEAYEEGGALVGLLTAIGFMLAFILDRLK